MKTFKLLLAVAIVAAGAASATSCKKGGKEEKKIPVTDVELNEIMVTLYVGETFELEADVSPDDATDPSIKWSSENEEVATVKGGTVTAVAEGEATIVAATTDGSEIEALCYITVEPDTPEPRITAQPESVTVTERDNLTLTVKARGEGTLTYQWQRSWYGLDDTWNNVGEKLGYSTFSGMTEETLTITDADYWAVEYFRCIVTNEYGSVISNPALVTVQFGEKVLIDFIPQFNLVAGTAGNAIYYFRLIGWEEPFFQEVDYAGLILSGFPQGVDGTTYLEIDTGWGCLYVGGDTSTVAGTYEGLTVTIDGVTSEPFSMTIDPK